MLQLLFAVAFSAVPLTLYVPPVRNLNIFVQTIQHFFRDSTLLSLRVYPRCRIVESPINGPCTSESASILPWLWVIQAVSCCQEIDISTLKELIDVAPVAKDDFCEKTRELIALRCFEDLYDHAYRIHVEDEVYGSLDPRPGLDFSRSCEDVLQQILDKKPLSDLKEVGAELLKWDIFPFILHKRATVKSDLEQLKESISEGTHPYTHYLRERSGLLHQNGGYQVHVNDNECSDLSKKDKENCTCGENMDARENSVSLILPSKRNRVESTNEQDMEYLHEKHININECDDYLINAKKAQCSASSNVESYKEKPASPKGEPLLENTNENFLLVSERGRHHPGKDVRENQGEGYVQGTQDSHDKCIASNWCEPSSSHNHVFLDESNIPFNATTTTMLQHTSECEPCQQHEGESVPPEALIHNEILHVSKDDTEHKVLKIINESQPKRKVNLQLKESAATVDKAVEVTVNACREETSSDSDVYHNEIIDLAAKKHECLSSCCTICHDISAIAGLTEKSVCVKCNEVGELLLCQTTTCSTIVHKSCLSTPAQIDAEGNFFCPFCAYCQTISEYCEAQKEASLARKELAIFISKDIGRQNTSCS